MASARSVTTERMVYYAPLAFVWRCASARRLCSRRGINMDGGEEVWRERERERMWRGEGVYGEIEFG